MTGRLNVSSGAGGKVAVRRARFDAHLDDCTTCKGGAMCPTAQTLWRNIVIEAIRAAR